MEDDALFAEPLATSTSASLRSEAPAEGRPKTFTWSRQEEAQRPAQQEGNGAEANDDEDSDEELVVNLDTPAEEEDGELEIDLDMSLQAPAEVQQPFPSADVDAPPASVPGIAANSHSVPAQAPRPLGTASSMGAPDSAIRGAVRPPMGDAPAFRGSTQQHQRPAHHRHPQLDLPPALPQQAQPGQLIKLPGQSRVAPDEYREFLILGHGGVFDLDIDNVVDAPWNVPGSDPRDFFNYGLNMSTWRQYCQRVRQYRTESSLQKKIGTYEAVGSHVQQSDLPPELAAAVAAEAEASMAVRAATPTMMPHQTATKPQSIADASSSQPLPLPSAAQPLLLPSAPQSQPPSPAAAPVPAEGTVPQQQVPASTVAHPVKHEPAQTAQQSSELPGSSSSAPVSDSRERPSEVKAEAPPQEAFPSLMEDSMFGSSFDLNPNDEFREPKRPRREGQLSLPPGYMPKVNAQPAITQ
ncbi:hypothetical protein WJX73_005584 [Symbiochloris irregularis]|uniref:Pre-mRNA polyadenylation factor Fip1 domain-containing protein n=1 Tax=Symbiochloris irregularis TaxID=706552 RepID=A0AAW1NQE2_9CHLO